MGNVWPPVPGAPHSPQLLPARPQEDPEPGLVRPPDLTALSQAPPDLWPPRAAGGAMTVQRPATDPRTLYIPAQPFCDCNFLS